MSFSFLQPYKIDPLKVDVSEAEDIGRKKHLFFPIPDIDLEEVLKTFDPFPVELKSFHEEIGFGFLHRRKGKLNMLLDPMSLINTNLKLGYFKEDPLIVNAFQHLKVENRLLFFKTHLGQYFSIDRLDAQGKNAVFYKEEQVDSSLYNFLLHYSRDSDYLKNYIDDMVVNERDDKGKDNHPNNQKNVKRLGGHVLIDPY
ncbi:MAG: hypothetical protein LBV72_00020 [Tannerella sp.]|jgi:hypothetical protein|nr:hypothetical protein [Tannerella sp.]